MTKENFEQLYRKVRVGYLAYGNNMNEENNDNFTLSDALYHCKDYQQGFFEQNLIILIEEARKIINKQ